MNTGLSLALRSAQHLSLVLSVKPVRTPPLRENCLLCRGPVSLFTVVEILLCPNLRRACDLLCYPSGTYYRNVMNIFWDVFKYVNAGLVECLQWVRNKDR